MITRAAFLALAAVFAAAGHAEELQVTLSGEASVLNGTSTVPVTPFTISYMFNTDSAQLTQVEFGPINGPLGGPIVLNDFIADFPVVNYTQIFGGVTTVSPQGVGHFNLDLTPGGGGYQMFGSGGPTAGSPGFGFDIGVEPLITQAQYMAFKDPLADVLGLFTPASSLGGDAIAFANGEEWALIGSISVSERSVSVPTPEPIGLFVAGLLGLIAARARPSARPNPPAWYPLGRGALGWSRNLVAPCNVCWLTHGHRRSTHGVRRWPRGGGKPGRPETEELRGFTSMTRPAERRAGT